MPEELTPREKIIRHQEDLIVIAKEFLSQGFSENLELYDDLIWQIKSIKNIEDYQEVDDYTVFWVLINGFKTCPLKRVKDSNEERSCVEVDCPRFNTCELTQGILDNMPEKRFC